MSIKSILDSTAINKNWADIYSDTVTCHVITADELDVQTLNVLGDLNVGGDVVVEGSTTTHNLTLVGVDETQGTIEAIDGSIKVSDNVDFIVGSGLLSLSDIMNPGTYVSIQGFQGKLIVYNPLSIIAATNQMQIGMTSDKTLTINYIPPDTPQILTFPKLTGSSTVSYTIDASGPFEFSGPWPSNIPDMPVQILKTGKTVSLLIPLLIATGDSSSDFIVSTTALPVGYRPKSLYPATFVGAGVLNGVDTIIRLTVGTNGIMTIGEDITNEPFASSGATLSGSYNIYCTYITD
jgi:hypothetical protein